MPWYRSGTVSITAGQTTVTGTSTDFAMNARVGDAFQGPDGRWYEVANIASSTVLSILPTYQGPTVAAGTYGLAPMQGYVKESADRLRQLVEQFGGTLALLGTPADAAGLRQNIGAASRGANSDITSLSGLTSALSISQGGTGGGNKADARANLGLSATNGTYTPDMNAPVTDDTFMFNSDTLNIPPFIAFGMVRNLVRSAGEIIQTAFSVTGDVWGYRRKLGGVWNPWVNMTAKGVGQTWQEVGASRVVGATYTNTTGRSINVNFACQYTAPAQYISALVSGVYIYGASAGSSGTLIVIGFEVPPGATYQLINNGGGSIVGPAWNEFR